MGFEKRIEEKNSNEILEHENKHCDKVWLYVCRSNDFL